MSTSDFIIDLFCRVDEVMQDVPKHPQAKLYPSEIVTLALLFALKGGGPRAFYRWLSQNYRDWFPGLPHRTRLLRLFATHHAWAEYCLAEPTLLGVADSYGIELRHPWREDRADQHEWRQNPVQSSLDRWGQVGLCRQPMGLGRWLGLCQCRGPRQRVSWPHP